MINWGIIGAGNIAHRFANSLEEVENAELYAVANRTIEKAKAFKEEHPSEKAYDSYNALLADENVDAVYIALPHKFHLEWVEKAIRAGKAVLCEKPATLSNNEMKKISSIANEERVFFMEAMKSRFSPAYQEVKQLIEEGIIGEVEEVFTSLCRVFPPAEGSYHYKPVQGGCLLDMGVYNAAFVEDFIDGPFELKNIEYELYEDQVEIYVKSEFQSGNQTAVIESAFDRNTETKAVITGTKGSITVPDFHRPTSYELELRGYREVVNVPYIIDDFYGEITHVMDCLEQNKIESSVMSLTHSENVATLLDQMKAAIQ